MRYGICSDIHSNLESLEAVIGAYKNESIDKYLCAGDVVGYAANPKECINRIEALPMIVVAGNHDWASINLTSVDHFNLNAKKAIFWTRDNIDSKDKDFLGSLKLVYKNEDLTLVHGSLENPEDFNYMADVYTAWQTFKLLETNICFVGHSHVVGIFTIDGAERINYQEDGPVDIKQGNRYIINVGSVGQPRDGNPDAAYCVYDTDRQNIQIKRISYDIQEARRKIIDAGLPHFLGDRLTIGR